MAKRFFRFSYYNRPRSKTTKRKIHELRDGSASLELVDVLYRKGYRYGGLLLNSPPVDWTDTSIQNVDAACSFLEPSDLILITTRPPLDRIRVVNGVVEDSFVDDPVTNPRERVEPGQNTLEKRIFEVMLRYFKHTKRDFIELEDTLACQLHPAFKDRACISFGVHGDGWYLGWVRPDGTLKRVGREKKLTAAYLLYTDETWQGGPSLLVSFGMTGQQTLIWNHLVRTKYADLLDEPTFIMAEIEMKEIPSRPIDLQFASDWNVHLLLPKQEDLIRRLSGKMDTASS